MARTWLSDLFACYQTAPKWVQEVSFCAGFMSAVTVSLFSCQTKCTRQGRSNGGWEQSVFGPYTLDTSALRFSDVLACLPTNYSAIILNVHVGCKQAGDKCYSSNDCSAVWTVWKAAVAPVYTILHGQVKWNTESNLSPFKLPTVSCCWWAELFHLRGELKGLLCLFFYSSLRALKTGHPFLREASRVKGFRGSKVYFRSHPRAARKMWKKDVLE